MVMIEDGECCVSSDNIDEKDEMKQNNIRLFLLLQKVINEKSQIRTSKLSSLIFIISVALQHGHSNSSSELDIFLFLYKSQEFIHFS